jgi:hypothetical protein
VKIGSDEKIGADWGAVLFSSILKEIALMINILFIHLLRSLANGGGSGLQSCQGIKIDDRYMIQKSMSNRNRKHTSCDLLRGTSMVDG